MRKFLALCSCFCIAFHSFSQEILDHFDKQVYDTSATAQSYFIPAKMEWWYAARFGMFIHFGSYSYYGHGEWCMFLEDWSKKDYQTKITKNFNPANFDAKQIVSVAKAAGMKYIVITAKHHEGFCMWNTSVADFKDYRGKKIFDLPHYLGFKRDLLMELKQECDRQGLAFCLYYSILDWNHHSQFHKDYWSQLVSMDAKKPFVEAEKRQLKELVERYHPRVLWFDGDWCENKDTADVFAWWTKRDAEDLYEYIMSLDSTIIVNERIKRNLGLGDFMCPEEKIPAKALPRQWETCQTMNYGWGFDSTKMDSYKSADTLIRELQAIVSRDGNYLLNVGLKGDGSMPQKDVEILTTIGSWMAVYGESIHGAKRSPFPQEPSWGYFTQKEGKLFCHVTAKSALEFISMPCPKNTVKRVYELSHPEDSLGFSCEDGELRISLKNIPQEHAYPYVVVVEKED